MPTSEFFIGFAPPIAAQNAAQLLELLQRNTELTELTQKLIERVETLTTELHEKLVQKDSKS